MFFNFAAIRTQQGGRPLYLVSVPYRMLRRFLEMDVGDVMDRSQRNTDSGRVKAIVKYMGKNPDSYVLPALTGHIEDPEMTFAEVQPNTNIGTLTLSMDAKVKLLDGQHRATAIMAALKEFPHISAHCVSIQLYHGLSLAERQQAFSDINSTAKQVSSSLTLTYSRRDNQLNAMAEQIGNVTAWKGRIDHERSAANQNNGHLFAYRHVVAATKLLLGMKKGDTVNPVEMMFAASFWNAISGPVGWTEETVSTEHVSNTAVGLMALALVGNWLLKQKTDGTPSIDPFKAAQAMFDIDWKKSAPIWAGVLVDSAGKMITGTAAQQAAAKVIIEQIEKKP